MRESNPLRLFQRDILAGRRMLRFLLRHPAHGSLGANRTHDLCFIRAAPSPLGDEAMGGVRTPVPSIEMVAGEVGLEPTTFLPGYGFPHGSGAGTRTPVC